MTRYTKTTLSSGYQSAAQIETNLTNIQTAITDSLSRKAGDLPNAMETQLDMNSNRVINLPSPASSSDAARWIDVTAATNVTGIVAPSQSGNSGKFLSTDGTSAIWQDVTAQYPTQTGNANKPLTTDGTSVSWGTVKSNYITHLSSKSNSVSRTLLTKLDDFVSVKDFGATGDGVTDDTTAINNALAASYHVYFPQGTYKISSTLTVSLNSAKLIGAGINLSVITSNSTTAKCITVNASLADIEIAGLTLTRSVTAASGGTGLDVSLGTTRAKIHDLIIQSQYIGIHLGPTGYSEFYDTVVQLNKDDGVKLVNSASVGQVQWQLRNILSTQNDGKGFNLTSIAGPANLALGDWVNLSTFANTSNGILVSGVACPVNGLRLTGGFIGEDGATSIYLDTYGYGHKIVGVEIELTGSSLTGSAGATAASNVGSGIIVTANNRDILISSCYIIGTSASGIRSSGTDISVIGCRVKDCAQAAIVSDQIGVAEVTGNLMVVGCEIGNTGAGTAQKYGVYAVTDNVVIVGCDLSNNATSNIGSDVTLTNSIVVGNLPGSVVDVHPNGMRGFTVAGLVVGAATGGDKGAGTINVSSNIYKNNTAYTNPDYVIEYWLDGKIEKFKHNEGASTYDHIPSLEEIEDHMKKTYQLPRVDTKSPTGIFDRADIALEKLEEAFIHLIDMNKRLKKLENN